MRLRSVVAGGALIAAGCGGLSHPLSNDGSDGGNPVGANPGTNVLTLNVATTSLTVGDTVSITGTLGGAALENNGLFQATTSDSSVATVGGVVIFARSVGSATINASYNGYQASSPIDIAVVPTPGGLAALVSDYAVSPPAFMPASVTIKAGEYVRFSIARGHSVAFDAVPGAPPGIPVASTGAVVDDQFPVAGTFAYHCSIHGESGVINVTP